MAVYHVSVTPEVQWRGQYVTAPQGSVFVSLHAMDRTAAAADRVSKFEIMGGYMIYINKKVKD